MSPSAARPPDRWVRPLVVVCLIAATLASTAIAKPPDGGNGAGRCTKRKPCDTTPPVVAIATPAPGATASGTLEIEGTAVDDVGIAAVTVAIDGADGQPADGTVTWTEVVDTTALPDGRHEVTAVATDAAGNLGVASLTIDVVNATPEPEPAPEPEPTPESPPEPEAPAAGTPVEAPPLAAGSIGGWVFQEHDRDGVFEEGETPMGGARMYLFDGAGNYLANAAADGTGWYRFGGLADGAYQVRYDPANWSNLWRDWAPSTTGSERPWVSLSLGGKARVDLGWRPIVRSTDVAAPISTFTAPNGLRIASYNDVVPAERIWESLQQGSLMGAEAARTVIRFDLYDRDVCSSSYVTVNGVYRDFSAGCSIAYLRWLDTGDQILFHEYGHAWATYHAAIVQQDPKLRDYLRARGISPSDPRLDTSHAWSRQEIIAEDFRQLFGSPNAQRRGQENTEIAPAPSVSGLREYLSTTFMQAPAS